MAHLALIIALPVMAAIPVQSAEAGAGVQFRMVGGFLVVVPLTLEGAGAFDFVVDTGTNTTLIDRELAEQLKLQPVGREHLETLTGAEVVTRYVLSSIQLGDKSMECLTVLGQSMGELHSLDPRIRGVLGLDFLMRFAFVVNYRRRRIGLYDPNQAPNFRNGIRVPIEIAESRILIPATSKESRQVTRKLALDSGIAQVLIFIDRSAHVPNPLPKGGNAIQVKTNLRGVSTKTMTIKDLQVGGVHFGDLPAAVLPPRTAIQGQYEDGLLPTVLFGCLLINPSQGYAVFQLRGGDSQRALVSENAKERPECEDMGGAREPKPVSVEGRRDY